MASRRLRPTALQIARRAVAAQVTAEFGISASHYARARNEKKKAEIVDNFNGMLEWVSREGILDWLTPRERSFLDSDLTEYVGPTEEAVVELECVGLLLWGMGLTNAPRTSQFSRNAYLETLHANEAAPDHGIISDAGLRPSDRDIVRSTQDMLVMADAYRLQLWRLDLAVRDTKARVDIRKVAPELIGESAENVLQLLSIERHGELVFDDRWTLVFYELFKGDIPWIRLVLLHRLKSLEWLLGGVVDWDLYAPELLTSAST